MGLISYREVNEIHENNKGLNMAEASKKLVAHFKEIQIEKNIENDLEL